MATTPPAVVVHGLGAALPPKVVTNDDLCATLDTSDEWISTRTGIRERRMVSAGLSTRDMAVRAGARALKSAGESTADAVVVATTSADRLCPAVAPEVAHQLGLSTVAAFDLTSACSGFLYGLAASAGLIRAGVAETVLFIGAEAFSTLVNPADRATAPIFGDGGGAVVLRGGTPDEPGALGPIDLGSDGAKADLLAIPAGGSRQRSASDGLGFDAVPTGDWYLHMSGRPLYVQAVARMAASSRVALDRAGWRVTDVDWFVGHQANLRIVSAVAGELGLARERVATNIEWVGNTLAASIPLLLTEYAARGDLKAGDRVLLSAFGAGLSWGSTTLVWPDLAVDAVDTLQ